MKKIWISFLFLMLSMSSFANNEQISPIGFWETIDDVTAKPKAIVELWLSRDHTLQGRILKLYPKDGKDISKELCEACQGENHNQPIVGLKFVENLKQNKENPNEWAGGTILDPKNGKIYKCYIQVKDNSSLNVRGYLGFSLFGRTQVWRRIQDPDMNSAI